jgi:antitoxin component of MazEF toxin-antitoxin module
MIQKVLKVGSSAAVTIPKKSLEELGLKIGDSVSVDMNLKEGVVSFRAAKNAVSDRERVTALSLDFVERYRSDLEALKDK